MAEIPFRAPLMRLRPDFDTQYTPHFWDVKCKFYFFSDFLNFLEPARAWGLIAFCREKGGSFAQDGGERFGEITRCLVRQFQQYAVNQ